MVEYRGVWIASVFNIDWPLASDVGNAVRQQQSLQGILDGLVKLNANTALLQVRPECDSLYKSAIEPWSRFLTGVQGRDPGYDPLAFAVEETHKRGLQIEAWLNPYRISATANFAAFHPMHVAVQHPEWVMRYDNGSMILNPGTYLFGLGCRTGGLYL